MLIEGRNYRKALRRIQQAATIKHSAIRRSFFDLQRWQPFDEAWRVGMADECGDLLGVKPLSKAVERGVDGLANFFGAICMPAAEELGLVIRDRVGKFRLKNLETLADKTQAKLEGRGKLDERGKLKDQGKSECGHASPQLLYQVVQEASWASDDSILDMWAGLLSVAATQPSDDSIVYTDLLKRLTPFQARFINYVYSDPRVASFQGGSIIDLQPFYTPANALIYSTREILELYPGDIAQFIPRVGDTHLDILNDPRLNIHAISRFEPQLRALAAMDLIHQARPRNAYKEGIHVFPTVKGHDFYMRCSGHSIYPIAAFMGLQLAIATGGGIDPFTCPSPGGFVA